MALSNASSYYSHRRHNSYEYPCTKQPINLLYKRETTRVAMINLQKHTTNKRISYTVFSTRQIFIYMYES